MQTRRELLFTLASTTIPIAHSRIIVDNDCLSQESASGFRLLLRRTVPRKMIVLPGARKLSRERGLALRDAAMRGTLVIIEGSPACALQTPLSDAFGFELQPPVSIDSTLYVRYTWPIERLVRHFNPVTPVGCSPHERVAEFGGITVCARRRLGAGQIIFLGSMLGPALAADEREAHDIAMALFA